MKKYILAILLFFTGTITGYSVKQSAQPIKRDQQYGLLRVAIPDQCLEQVSSISHSSITNIEPINFDMKLNTIYSSKFLRIEHTGLPHSILEVIYNHWSDCLADTLVTYDSSSMLVTDFQNYLNLSYDTPVYVVIEQGKAVFHFKSDD